MTTEVNQEVEVQKEVELTPIQQKAVDQGWKPKEQFQGEPDDFIDAAEFVRRGELFEKIERQSREVKQLKDALVAFKQHHTKVKEAEYNRALKAVEAARKQAFDEGDRDKFFALEQQMDSIKDEAALVKEAAKEVVEPSTPQALEVWAEKNSWYQSNRAMTAFADRVGAELHAKGYTLEQALREIDAEVRKEFPEKFQGNRRPPQPESSSRAGAPSKASGFKPSDDERRVAKKFVAQGLFETEAAYYKELERLQGE